MIHLAMVSISAESPLIRGQMHFYDPATVRFGMLLCVLFAWKNVPGMCSVFEVPPKGREKCLM